MKKNIFRLVLSFVAVLSVFAATTSAGACWPLTCYQPKAPRSLIRAD